jgi:hypothetical protein
MRGDRFQDVYGVWRLEGLEYVWEIYTPEPGV